MKNIGWKMYEYPTNEGITDPRELAQDPGKLLRESSLICAAATFPWKTGIDFGTGTGRNLPVLKQASLSTSSRIIAYDVDGYRVAASRKAYGSTDDYLFESGDLDFFSKKIPNDSIDLILCCQVLGHLPRKTLTDVMSFFCEKLHKNGKLILCVPFLASESRQDFYHFIDCTAKETVDFRTECTSEEFDGLAKAPSPGVLPIRAFGIGRLSGAADNSSLPVPCEPPHSLSLRKEFINISSFVYSIHTSMDDDGTAIGDMILKFEKT